MAFAFAQKQILVVGDFLLDRYIKGKVDRISPEAPVPVLHVEQESMQPGGSGNVALNLAAMGMQVFCLGRVGKDVDGKMLVESLNGSRIDTQSIIAIDAYPTPVKTRLIGGSQQIVRMDKETILPLSIEAEEVLLAQMDRFLSGIDLVVVSDYGKGFLTTSLLKGLIVESARRKIPLIVDPKGLDFTKYQGATLIKPNKKEAYLAAGSEPACSLEKVASILLEQTHVESLLITRSEEGMTLYQKEGSKHYPVSVQDVTDVTGAGDTTLAMMAVCMANKIAMGSAVELANIAASIAIEKVGCYAVSLEEVMERYMQRAFGCKKLSWTQQPFLKSKLFGKKIFFIECDLSLGWKIETSQFLESLKNSSKDGIVVVSIKQENKPWIDLLSSMSYIDYIADESTKEMVFNELPLEKVYSI